MHTVMSNLESALHTRKMGGEKIAKSRHLRAIFQSTCKTGLKEKLLQYLCTHTTSPSHASQLGWLYTKPFLHETL